MAEPIGEIPDDGREDQREHAEHPGDDPDVGAEPVCDQVVAGRAEDPTRSLDKGVNPTATRRLTAGSAERRRTWDLIQLYAFLHSE